MQIGQGRLFDGLKIGLIDRHKKTQAINIALIKEGWAALPACGKLNGWNEFDPILAGDRHSNTRPPRVVVIGDRDGSQTKASCLFDHFVWRGAPIRITGLDR